jgi:hypothetical protein
MFDDDIYLILVLDYFSLKETIFRKFLFIFWQLAEMFTFSMVMEHWPMVLYPEGKLSFTK